MSRYRIAVFAALAGLALTLSPTPGSHPALAQGREWCGEYSRNTVWEQLSSPHIITCDVIIRNSVLTIQPGAFVLFEEGTNLIIDSGSTLEAVGNENGRIRFRAVPDDVEPGFWGQIRIDSGSAGSQLEFVDVQDGGKNGDPMVEIRGSVVQIGTQPAQRQNVRFSNAGGVPLAITANDLGPSLEAAGAFAVGRVCEQVKFETSNTINAIQILAAGDPDVTDLQTWHSFCVPYRANEVVSIGGPSTPKLTLDSSTIQFGPEAGLIAGYDATNPGQLETTGGVTLTGVEETPGSWLGVDLTDFSGGGHSFGSVTTEYGGRGGRPMVTVSSLDTISYDAFFRHAASYPLEIVVGGVESFTDGLTAASSEPYFADNGVQRVLVNVDRRPGIDSTTRWGGIGVPYEIPDDLVVAGPGLGPTFRLFDGADLAFAPGKSLVVGDATVGAGSLDVSRFDLAGGFEGDVVVLEGLEDTPGAWGGVRLSEKARSTLMGGAHLKNGGSQDHAMLEWLGGTGVVTTTVFTGAPNYPLSIAAGLAGNLLQDCRPVDSPMAATDCLNSAQDNGENRFLVTGQLESLGGALQWYTPGAPVEMESSIALESSGVTRLALHDGLELLFRPGTGIHAGIDATKRGEVLLVDDDPDREVRVGPTNVEAGWTGIDLRAHSRMSGADGVLAGGAAGDATITAVDATVDLRNVTLRDAAGAGIAVEGPDASALIADSRIVGNDVGAVARDRAHVRIVRSTVQGNTTFGVLNEHRAFCIEAIRVFWGRQAGPDDASDAPDNCMTAANPSPGADKVSDFVDWWPYATSADGYPPAGGLGPNPKTVYLPALTS